MVHVSNLLQFKTNFVNLNTMLSIWFDVISLIGHTACEPSPVIHPLIVLQHAEAADLPLNRAAPLKEARTRFWHHRWRSATLSFSPTCIAFSAAV
jgi:hypothetical protein